MANTILNASNIPLNEAQGTVPNVNGGMRNWNQELTFTLVTKMTKAFQVVETGEEVSFRGVIQPLSNRDLQLRPEGQRAWTWFMLHADPALVLQVDEVVVYLGVQTRVMARKDYKIYGYIYYELVQDYSGAGPEIEE